MTRDKGRESDGDSDEAPVQDREAFAAAETRVLSEEDASISETQVADSEAATVLAEEDDRTHVVTRPRSSSEGDALDAGAETRLLDSDAQPIPPHEVEPQAETRVLDLPEDKTSPPAVSTPKPRSAPTPIDSERGLPPGMVLFGEYEIVNVLGVGGMGEVYRARHRRLDEHRAIKVMHAELSKKKGASEFFYREAKALLAVRHPAVVHCHDLLSDDDGRVYLIMEMIEGIPLSKKMNDGPLSADDVAILGARVAHGLSAAHRKGVIHRDVSPDNIVLPNGRVQEAKLIDFGIAKILQEGEGTIIDGFKGKLSYASPEQLGFFGGKMDGSSDFYSLGLVLVAAALGRPMSMGTTVMEAVDARRGFGSLPDEIPVGLRSAIQPLLALDPKDRPKYVDRLFVVPGGTEGTTDPGGYGSAGGASPRASSQQAAGNRTGLIAGISAAAAMVVAGGIYFAAGGEALISQTSNAPQPTRSTQEATATTVAVNPPAQKPRVEPNRVDPAPIVANEAVPAVVAKVEPVPPRVRRLTASDRIKIIGLLNNAKLALDENRLMSPANDNAYDRYQRIIALDPSNQKAKDGLRKIAARYLGLSNAAAAKGDLGQARTFLGRARKADADHPGISAAEAELAR